MSRDLAQTSGKGAVLSMDDLGPVESSKPIRSLLSLHPQLFWELPKTRTGKVKLAILLFHGRRLAGLGRENALLSRSLTDGFPKAEASHWEVLEGRTWDGVDGMGAATSTPRSSPNTWPVSQRSRGTFHALPITRYHAHRRRAMLDPRPSQPSESVSRLLGKPCVAVKQSHARWRPMLLDCSAWQPADKVHAWYDFSNVARCRLISLRMGLATMPST
jgi:hypothetical protein